MVNRNHNLKQYPEKKSIPYSHLHSLWLETGNSVGNAITLSGNLKGKIVKIACYSINTVLYFASYGH